MNSRLWPGWGSLAITAVFGMSGILWAADDSNKEALQMVVDLVRDKDRDMRALGLQQVREMPKDPVATKRFAALLPELASDAQVELLGALASRADSAARPAVLDLGKSPEEPVQVAVLRALGALGTPADVPLLVHALSASESKRTAAEASLTQLCGEGVTGAITDAMKDSTAEIRIKLLQILGARRAVDGILAVLEAAQDSDARVRAAATAVLGKLAGPEHVPGMLKAALKAEPGTEREMAEKAVMFVCERITDANKRADPLLATWSQWSADEQITLLPLLGRIGSPAALKVVSEAIADKDQQRHDAGVRALCNWPDASVAPQLEELVRSGHDAAGRTAALRALIRVAALPDQRSDAEKLNLLTAAMTMATRDEERNLVLRRVRAVRAIESLRFVLPYLSQPAFAQEACATVVELAHHRELREPNKLEFDKALDVVIRVAKDPKVVDRAKRYKRGQT